MFVEDLLSKLKDGQSYSLFLRRTLTQTILLLPQEMVNKFASLYLKITEQTMLGLSPLTQRLHKAIIKQ